MDSSQKGKFQRAKGFFSQGKDSPQDEFLVNPLCFFSLSLHELTFYELPSRPKSNPLS